MTATGDTEPDYGRIAREAWIRCVESSDPPSPEYSWSGAAAAVIAAYRAAHPHDAFCEHGCVACSNCAFRFGAEHLNEGETAEEACPVCELARAAHPEPQPATQLIDAAKQWAAVRRERRDAAIASPIESENDVRDIVAGFAHEQRALDALEAAVLGRGESVYQAAQREHREMAGGPEPADYEAWKYGTAAAPVPLLPTQEETMRDERTVVGDSVASEPNSWESLAAELREALAVVAPGHWYTREHFAVDATQFVGGTPAKVHAEALDVIIDRLPAVLDLLGRTQPEPAHTIEEYREAFQGTYGEWSALAEGPRVTVALRAVLALAGVPAAGVQEPAPERPEWVKLTGKPWVDEIHQVIEWSDDGHPVVQPGALVRYVIDSGEWVPAVPPVSADALGASIVRQYANHAAAVTTEAKRRRDTIPPVSAPEPEPAQKCGHHDTDLTWIADHGWRCPTCFPELFGATAPELTPDRPATEPIDRDKVHPDGAVIYEFDGNWTTTTFVEPGGTLRHPNGPPAAAPSPDPERRQRVADTMFQAWQDAPPDRNVWDYVAERVLDITSASPDPEADAVAALGEDRP